MPHLVGTSSSQNQQLNNTPPNDTRISALTLVTEKSFSVSNVLLLHADLLELSVQVLNLQRQIVHVFAGLGIYIVRSSSSGNVKKYSVSFSVQPVGIEWGQTEAMFTGVMGVEHEVTIWVGVLVNNTMIVMEGLVDCDLHLQSLVFEIVADPVVKLIGVYLPDHQGVRL